MPGLSSAALRQDLLFGFWHRPGHGTFLKNVKNNPDDVASWLRWDGLFSHIWSELPRSKANDWARAVKDERHKCACPICGGSGHGIAAALLLLRGRSLAEWALDGTVQDLREALEELPASRRRQKATQKRLLHCLMGTGNLSTPAEGHASLAEVVRRAFVTRSA
jgi:excinuclease UvrABC ATPase subunit